MRYFELAEHRTRLVATARREASPAILVALAIVALILISGLKILREYERAVVFRLGQLTPYRGPGVTFIFPIIERMVRIDLRTVTLEIPAQDVITRDNVSVKVSAVVYFRVVDPSRAVVEIQNYLFATLQLAQTTLRSVGGQTELDELWPSGRSSTHASRKSSTRRPSPGVSRWCWSN